MTTSHTTATSSTSSMSTVSSSPTPYILITKPGTDVSVFQAYIKSLPDGGTGGQIVYPNVPWQGYVTQLTAEQADGVSMEAFVDIITIITEDNADGFGANPPAQKFNKRVARNQNLQRRQDSQQHLRVISTANQQDINGVLGAALPNYLFDPLLGTGQTIYVVDSGARPSHSDFENAGRQIRQYVVPNKYTLGLFPDLNPGLYAPEDLTDYSGHGTHVASVATGGVYGVASKADLVIVKFRNAAVNPFNLGTGRFLTRGVTQVALLDAWSWIINDVADQKQKGNAGKFFINMSYGKSISTRSKLAVNRISSRLFLSFDVIHQDGRESVMNRVLNECWDNDGEIGKTLDETTPQNAGTTSNGLITVGGVDSDGMLHDITNFKSDRRGGSITAGLAAYFFSLPSLAGEWNQGTVATDMKNYISGYAYVRNEKPIPAELPSLYMPPAADSIKVAYNRAPEGLCGTEAPSKRSSEKKNLAKKQIESGPSDSDVVVSGTIVASDLSQLVCQVSSTSVPPTPTSGPESDIGAIGTVGSGAISSVSTGAGSIGGLGAISTVGMGAIHSVRTSAINTGGLGTVSIVGIGAINSVSTSTTSAVGQEPTRHVGRGAINTVSVDQ